MRYIYHNVGKSQKLRALCRKCYKMVTVDAVPERIYFATCPECKTTNCLSINNLGGDETKYYNTLLLSESFKCDCGNNVFYFTEIHDRNITKTTFPVLCCKCGKVKEKAE